MGLDYFTAWIFGCHEIFRKVYPQITQRDGAAIKLGTSQYHLAVAGGCEASDQNPRTKLRTHPLPRGGTDCSNESLQIKQEVGCVHCAEW